MKFSRRFASWGPVDSWEFSGGNGSGWAGMMVAKACGMYEVGPFDVPFPPNAIRVGSSWTSPVHLGNEGFDSSKTQSVKGNNPLCTYHLESVDPARQLVIISFRVEARITSTFYSSFDKKIDAYNHTVKQSGTWTIDLESGMPRRYDSKRFSVTDDGHPTRPELESTVTTMTRN